MIHIPTAPNLAEALTERIRDHRRTAGSRYCTDNYTAPEPAGRFVTVGEATVAVTAIVKFSASYGYGKPDRRHVQVGATAKCHGHGCTQPTHETPLTDTVPLDQDADETVAAGMAVVQKAREWAQAHAETCRAMPAGGAR